MTEVGTRPAGVLGGFSSPLRAPAFRLLLLGQVASRSGDMVFTVALASYALARAPHGGLLAEVLLAQSVSTLVVLVLSGALTDRVGPRAILLAADAARTLALVVLAVHATTHGGDNWIPIAVGAVIGVGDGVFQPAFMVALTEVTPAEHRVAGNALRSLTWRLAAMAGAALGGIVVASAGTGTGFAVAAGGFVVSGIAVLRMGTWPRTDSVEDRPRASVLADLREGVVYLRSAPRLMALIVTSGLVTSLVMAPARVLMPLVLTGRFGTPELYSVVLTIEAVGGLTAAVLIGRHGAMPRRGAVATGGMVVYSGGYLMASQSFPIGLSLAALAVGALAITASAVAYASILQRAVPTRYLGRVASFDSLLTIGGAPVVLSAVPLACTYLGASHLMALTSGAAALAALCGLLNSRVRTL